jgi:hypothetical protein
MDGATVISGRCALRMAYARAFWGRPLGSTLNVGSQYIQRNPGRAPEGGRRPFPRTQEPAACSSRVSNSTAGKRAADGQPWVQRSTRIPQHTMPFSRRSEGRGLDLPKRGLTRPVRLGVEECGPSLSMSPLRTLPHVACNSFLPVARSVLTHLDTPGCVAVGYIHGRRGETGFGPWRQKQSD